MSRETLKYLHDILAAADLIARFVAQKQFADYQCDAMLRSAVERQFEIIGEALNQLGRRAPDLVREVRGYKRAIAFRNILIHGYADVDDEIVWRVIEDDLPLLQYDIGRLQEHESTG
ncbi:MAG: DUF86 domain-containing protein [Nitrosospira sp.]|nr:DUF86 domain-containing protein [Nitrosospira sp.]